MNMRSSTTMGYGHLGVDILIPESLSVQGGMFCEWLKGFILPLSILYFSCQRTIRFEQDMLTLRQLPGVTTRPISVK